MSLLTISAAARYCGVHRRTLQRAIQHGRLQLTPGSQLTIEALQQAGYTTAVPHVTQPQINAAASPQDTPHAVPHVLERIAEHLTKIVERLELLCDRLEPHAAPQGMPQVGTAVAPHVTPQRRTTKTPQVAPQGDTAAAPQRHAKDVSVPVTVTEAKHGGRPPVLRKPILALLQEHQAGLSAAELKVYLKTEKHIGDTLAGMVKAELLVKDGRGKTVRYLLADAAGKDAR